MIAIRVASARQAVGLLNGATHRGLLQAQSREVLISSDAVTVPVGIDGESVHLSTPVRCTVRPGALRVRLPRERPGVRPPSGRLDWSTLWALALGRKTAADAFTGLGQLTPPAGRA
jgi:hypothetical protein